MSNSAFYGRGSVFHPKTERTTAVTNSKVRCAACKNYVPRAEALRVSNGMTSSVCSSECLSDLYDKRNRKPKIGGGKAGLVGVASSKRPTVVKVPVAVREAVKERDGHLCRWCGARGSQCHHVLFRSQGGKDEPSNLITLCAECHHSKAHGFYAKWYRAMFRAYIWLAEVEDQCLFGVELSARAGELVDIQIQNPDS